MGLKVLLVGNGGREHSLAWKIAQSPRLEKLYIAPGNPGTDELGQNINRGPGNVLSLVKFVERKGIDLTVVGPEGPLSSNIAGILAGRGHKVFGPTVDAARLETSKAYAKRLMDAASIPTARYELFDDYRKARQFLRNRSLPVVLKASGLAAGKGVFVCRSAWDVIDALDIIMRDRELGPAGDVLVVEDCLVGREVSVHAFADGANYRLMPFSQDHKTLFEGGRGPNTGGMGVVAPVPIFSGHRHQENARQVVERTLKESARRGWPFSGCLYPGLMVTDGGSQVLEYNVRFGDPEAQVLMCLLKSDFLDAAEACADGNLDQAQIEWHDGFAVCVVIASPGYPASPTSGLPVSGVERAASLPNVHVFHAGTAVEHGNLVTAGGRVLSVVGTGDTVEAAQSCAYDAIKYIHFDGMHFRQDIGAYCQ